MLFVTANHCMKNETTIDDLPSKHNKSFISNLMNPSAVIQNPRTHKQYNIEGELSKWPNKLILGHLNINSARNKFQALKYIINNNTNLLLISDTKLDDSFPTAQFQMKGFSVPYRYDRNRKSGGLLLYIRKDIEMWQNVTLKLFQLRSI